MKRVVLILFFSFTVLPFIRAQDSETFGDYKARKQKEFNEYKEARRKEFEAYRLQRNKEFAEYLRKVWTPVKSQPVVPKPKEDDVPPVVLPKKEPVTPPAPPAPLPFDKIVDVPKPKPQPKPIDPIEEVPQPVSPQPIEKPQPSLSFSFYGLTEKVRFDKSNLFKLNDVSENTVADAWLKLSGESYTNLIHDCLEIRDRRNLCDWAYLSMLKQMSEAVCGQGSNEATLLMAYVYCQSGYKMRLGNSDGKLCFLFATKFTLYDWGYYTLDNEKYYPIDKEASNIQISMQNYPEEQMMSLNIPKDQNLNQTETEKKLHQSERYADTKTNSSVNKNLLDFYNSYPTSMIGDNAVSRWAMYANTPLSNSVKEQIYPRLREAISGCAQLEAVNKLLNYVQTGFVYEYDDKVWGCDRAFFAEESLYYPYCDCEDRSILFSRLIRDLLKLDVVLIYYPGHLATAVHFTQSVSGDYLLVDNTKFTVCDPTYIGAPVGATMPNMDNSQGKVILLENN